MIIILQIFQVKVNSDKDLNRLFQKNEMNNFPTKNVQNNAEALNQENVE